MTTQDGPPTNAVLSALSQEDLQAISPHLELVELPWRQRLAEANRPIRHVYFPRIGIASVVHGLPKEAQIEIGLVGREGFVNVPAVLGADRAPNEILVQVPGEGHRIEVDRLRAAMDAHPGLRRVCLRYCNAFMVQVAQTVLANGRANLRERLARWLLMASDRQGEPDLPLTHEFLSMMLGVRRSSVTVALREFEQLGLISRRRALIRLLNRDDLVHIADRYYGVAERELTRMLGSPGVPAVDATESPPEPAVTPSVR